jgi:hypothetical protein
MANPSLAAFVVVELKATTGCLVNATSRTQQETRADPTLLRAGDKPVDKLPG